VGGMDCVACVAASYRLLLDTAVGRQQIRSSDEEN
jgi:hypothetical protein